MKTKKLNKMKRRLYDRLLKGLFMLLSRLAKWISGSRGGNPRSTLGKVREISGFLILSVFFVDLLWALPPEEIKAMQIDGVQPPETRAAETVSPVHFGELLTLEEAVARAVQNGAQVKRATERLLKEESLYKGRRAEFFPKIKTDIFQAFATGDQHSLTYFDTAIEQPLFQGGKNVAEKRKQKTRAESEQFMLERAKLDLELAVRILYAQILAHKELVRLAQGEVKELILNHDRIKKLHEREILPRYEALRAEALLEKAKHALVESKETFDYYLALLKEAAGLGEGESLELEPLRDLPEPAPEVAAYLESARRNDPLYKVKELEVREKEFERNALKADRYPHVNLTARWNLYRDVFVDTDRVMVGIAGNWNIWDFGRLGAEIKAKTHEINETKWAGEAEIRENENEIRRLFHALRASREGIRLHESFVREKQEAYKNAKARFIAGEKGAGELLETFLAFENSKMELIRALADYRVLLARLERHGAFESQGKDTAKDLER